jgi:hypothetical protein
MYFFKIINIYFQIIFCQVLFSYGIVQYNQIDDIDRRDPDGRKLERYPESEQAARSD